MKKEKTFYDGIDLEKFEKPRIDWWSIADIVITLTLMLAVLVLLFLFLSTKQDLNWIEKNKVEWCLIK